MKKLTQAASITAITFLVTLVVNFVVEVLSADNGTILIGQQMMLSGQLYTSVDIVNFSKKPIDGLLIRAPRSVERSDFNPSGPIQIDSLTNLVGTAQSTLFVISAIPPRSTTRVLVSLSTNQTAAPLQIVNSAEKNLSVESVEETRGPRWDLLKRASVNAGVYSVFFLLFTLWMKQQASKFKEQSEKFSAELKEVMGRLEANKRELDAKVQSAEKNLGEVRASAAKLRILLFARMSDLSKELEFWRDTIRRLVYASVKGPKKVDKIFEQVTTTLETHATRKNWESEFKTIETLAMMLSEKKGPNPKEPVPPLSPDSSTSG